MKRNTADFGSEIGVRGRGESRTALPCQNTREIPGESAPGTLNGILWKQIGGVIIGFTASEKQPPTLFLFLLYDKRVSLHVELILCWKTLLMVGKL